jgi:hypothetical protein
MVSKLSVDGIFEEQGCKEQADVSARKNEKQKVIEPRKKDERRNYETTACGAKDKS